MQLIRREVVLVSIVQLVEIPTADAVCKKWCGIVKIPPWLRGGAVLSDPRGKNAPAVTHKNWQAGGGGGDVLIVPRNIV